MTKAIAHFSNGIGNFIMMMPALQAMASLSSDNVVDIIIDSRWTDHRKPAVIEICKAWSVIGRVIKYPSEKFNKNNYGHWFFTTHGTAYDAPSIFLPRMKKIIPKPHWRPSQVHEVDHYMDIAMGAGYKGLKPEVQFPLAKSPVVSLPRPIIGLCNGYFRTSTHYWDKKGWYHFPRLSEVLALYFGGSVVGLGREGELPKGTKLAADYAGKLSILETAKVLSQLDLFVTTDTGLMHMADILKVPTIAMFGPTLVTKSGIRGENSHILQAGLKCAPCQEASAYHICKVSECMRSIGVDDVMAKAREILGGKADERYHHSWSYQVERPPGLDRAVSPGL